MSTSKNAQDDLQLITVLNDANSTEKEKQKAFEKIYSRYQNQLSFFFSKNIKDSETAEDLKMIAFEKVHMNIGNYDSSKAVFSSNGRLR
jgi:DNA-directed RNA polymerase specialized sigma24 family protein